jgi:hypothetical protein
MILLMNANCMVSHGVNGVNGVGSVVFSPLSPRESFRDRDLNRRSDVRWIVPRAKDPAEAVEQTPLTPLTPCEANLFQVAQA